ncbi:MAG: hypothetical protein CSB06_00975 [Bacteroidia bacterium]|nr:MAG: hypothetical protein CSB06_00975 [Bacteroidia bacterium]
MKKIIFISLIISSLFVSCNKTDFDKVPEYKPDITELKTISIDSLKSMYKGSAFKIEDDFIVKGVVTSSDESQNFHKELFFEDESGGICLRLDSKKLYNKFPPGQAIYVRCKGLYINDYKGTMQLGFGSKVGRLPAKFMDDEKIPDILPEKQPVEALLRTIPELSNKDACRLIKLENVQFQESELSKKYYTKADEDPGKACNRILEDCEGNTIPVRTGSYATFADQELPKGKGTITALFQIHRSDYQLKIISIEDVQLNGERCSK